MYIHIYIYVYVDVQRVVVSYTWNLPHHDDAKYLGSSINIHAAAKFLFVGVTCCRALYVAAVDHYELVDLETEFLKLRNLCTPVEKVCGWGSFSTQACACMCVQ